MTAMMLNYFFKKIVFSDICDERLTVVNYTHARIFVRQNFAIGTVELSHFQLSFGCLLDVVVVSF